MSKEEFAIINKTLEAGRNGSAIGFISYILTTKPWRENSAFSWQSLSTQTTYTAWKTIERYLGLGKT